MATSEFIKYIGIILVLLVLIILSYVFASGGIENTNKALCTASAKVRQFWYHSPIINIPLLGINIPLLGAATFSHLSGWAPPLLCSPSKKILDLTKSNRSEILDKIAKEIFDCYAKYGGTADDGPYDILMDNAPNPSLCSIIHLKLGENKLNMSDVAYFFITHNVTSLSVRDCDICTNESNPTQHCPQGFTCSKDGSVCEQQYRDCEKERIPGVKICPCPSGYECKLGDPTKCVNTDDPSKEIDAPICFNYTAPFSCRINFTYADMMMAGRIMYDSYGISTCNQEEKSITCNSKIYNYPDPIFCNCDEPYGDYAYCLNLTRLKEDLHVITDNDICLFAMGNLSIEKLCERYANYKEEFNCAATNSEIMCDDSYGCVWPKTGYSLPFFGFIEDEPNKNLYSVSADVITGEVDLFIFFADHYIRALIEGGEATLSDTTKYLPAAGTASRAATYFSRYLQAARWYAGAFEPLSYWKTLKYEIQSLGAKEWLKQHGTTALLQNPSMRYTTITAMSSAYTGAAQKVPVAFSIPSICGGGCGHTAGGWEAWSGVVINCGIDCVPCAAAAGASFFTAGATIVPVLKQCVGCITCLSVAGASSITCQDPRITLSEDSIFLCYHPINPALDTTPGCGGMEEICCAGDQCDYDYLTCSAGKCSYVGGGAIVI